MIRLADLLGGTAFKGQSQRQVRGQGRVRVPWRAAEVPHPSGEGFVGRFDARKAASRGCKHSRDDEGGQVEDLAPNFRPFPCYDDYDFVFIQLSGGKDSVACVTRVMRDIGHRPDLVRRVELWHQDVDGNGPAFMDWPVTVPYCEAIAAAYGVKFQRCWRDGGFLGEIRRGPGVPRGPKMWQPPWTGPEGQMAGRAPTKGNEQGRLRFPMPMAADMNARWCTNELKTDVAKGVLAVRGGDEGLKILWITGERAEESKRRTTYFRGQDGSSTQGRVVHHLRMVYDHAEDEVWDELRFAFPGRSYGLQCHPAYELGWGRCSCAGCIFSGPDEWARLEEVLPEQYARIVAEEAAADARARRGAFPNVSRATIKGGGGKAGPKTVPELVRDWRAKHDGQPAIDPALLRRWGPLVRGAEPWTDAHALRGLDAPVFGTPWRLPAGAFTGGASAGPP